MKLIDKVDPLQPQKDWGVRQLIMFRRNVGLLVECLVLLTYLVIDETKSRVNFMYRKYLVAWFDL